MTRRNASSGLLDYVLVGGALAVVFGVVGLLVDTVLSAIFAAVVGFVLGAFGPLAFDAMLRQTRNGGATENSGSPADDLRDAVRQIADTGLARWCWGALRLGLAVPQAAIAALLGGLGMLLAILLALLPSERRLTGMLNNSTTWIVLLGLLLVGGVAGTVLWGFEVAFYIALALTPIWLIAMIVLSIAQPAKQDETGKEG